MKNTMLAAIGAFALCALSASADDALLAFYAFKDGIFEFFDVFNLFNTFGLNFNNLKIVNSAAFYGNLQKSETCAIIAITKEKSK